METFDWYTWVILPSIVFIARMTDVTLGTLRIIFLSRGRKFIAPLLGFIEVFIWITVVSHVLKGDLNFAAYIGYAGGFAFGNYVGMRIEEKLAIGTLVIRVILTKKGKTLVKKLRDSGYGATYVNGMGADGPIVLIYTVVMRRELKKVTDIINGVSPKAFFTVEELRSAQQGIFPVHSPNLPLQLSNRPRK